MSDCIRWEGSYTRDGYGVIQVAGRQWRATRWLWTQAHGDIPEGMLVCHTCDNPWCVELTHLWLGTVSENAKDSVVKGRHPKAAQRFCKRGHEFTQENTYLNPGEPYGRQCRECRKMHSRNRGREKVVADG